MYTFSKQKMLDRIKEEGRLNMVDAEAEKMMDNLDGCEATTSCWRRVVHQEPVMWVVGKDGNGAYVNENDCISA